MILEGRALNQSLAGPIKVYMNTWKHSVLFDLSKTATSMKIWIIVRVFHVIISFFISWHLDLVVHLKFGIFSEKNDKVLGF